MRKTFFILALALACASQSWAQEKAPLRLSQTINVAGARKWDHFGVDLKGNRLFVTSEEEPAVEVFDLRTYKQLQSLTDFKEPHNVLPFPELKKIFVVDGGASEVKILDYDSYKLIGRIALTIDADPVVYDPSSKFLYVVNGGREAHTPTCLISIVDTVSGKKIADLKLDTNRLESMAIEKSGPRLFVNMTGINSIGVVDREKRAVVATWPVTAGKDNVPLQYDEAEHRLFLATRKPSKLVVVNADNGKEVANLDVADYVDDLAYDAAHHRLYLPGGGGDGAVTVVAQRGADEYKVVATIPTKPGAKTARLVPELNKYFVGVPAKDSQPAQILVYDVAP
ncbi:MAG: YncE family protein [Acidobacteriia bacterium]|nr:YncE family protein [Terriglobia bacterium]